MRNKSRDKNPQRPRLRRAEALSGGSEERRDILGVYGVSRDIKKKSFLRDMD